MKVLHLCSELTPFSKTGGLADVAAGLPSALAHIPGMQVVIVSPRYGCVDPKQFAFKRQSFRLPVTLGTRVEYVDFFQGTLPQNPRVLVYLVEHPSFADRMGIYGPIQDPGQEYEDNAFRFFLLSKAALALASTFAEPIDVLHAHDWQTAPILYQAAQLNFGEKASLGSRAARIFTIHNLAYQGVYSVSEMKQLGVHEKDLNVDGFEFYGQASLLKAGLLWADQVTTVSPRYCQEICTPGYGLGFDGLLRKQAGRLTGILNGIDEKLWDPSTDLFIPRNYNLQNFIIGKSGCKAALQQELGFPCLPRIPLCATISRLTPQKGIELILQGLEKSQGFDYEFQYVVLGQGDPALEARLLAYSQRHPERLVVRLGYDEALAHRIEAAADLFLMPSKFEPCGLNQMYSLRYGTIPVVHAVGGLADTVLNYDPVRQTGTGFVFDEDHADAFLQAWQRAMLTYYRDPVAFLNLIRRGMAVDYSWTRSAKEYVALYERAQKFIQDSVATAD